MSLSSLILKALGWGVDVSVPDLPKCLICVAPHTSNWDFVLGKLAYASVGRHAGFLMKEQWFFWPLGIFFRAIGGVPVPRKNKRGSLVEAVVNMFNNSSRLQLAITPEGTRSRNPHWHTGFLHIALNANVPIQLAVFDFKSKTVYLNDIFIPTGDIERDLRTIKDFYAPYQGKYPEKFTTEDE